MKANNLEVGELFLLDYDKNTLWVAVHIYFGSGGIQMRKVAIKNGINAPWRMVNNTDTVTDECPYDFKVKLVKIT